MKGSLTQHIDSVARNPLCGTNKLSERSLTSKRALNELLRRRKGEGIASLRCSLNMALKELGKKFRSAIPSSSEDHKLIKVNVGRYICPKLNSDVAAIVAIELERRARLNRGKLHGHAWNRQKAVAEKVRKQRL